MRSERYAEDARLSIEIFVITWIIALSYVQMPDKIKKIKML
jgi:hypothetical protein